MTTDKPCPDAPPDVARHVVVHKGALGDFLLIWPVLLSLARALTNSLNSEELYWAGREAHASWAAAAGWRPAPPAVLGGVESLYVARQWPAELERSGVCWLGLRTNPLEIQDPRLWFLPCVRQGCFVSPRQIAREALEARGIAWAENWRTVWGAAFGAWRAQGPFERDVLLFPGAGHKAKHWGLVQFFELALGLQEKGRRVAFVLGPAEVERGLDPLIPARGLGRTPLPEVLRPGSLRELSSLLLGTRGVVGNDCGPLHLAAMHGVPGVVLFGPTSRRQWAPEGLLALAGEAACRPCTQTTADIQCEDVVCMRSIAPDQVLEALEDTALV